MSEELKITELEAQKINLQPGDVLLITVRHDEVSQESLDILKGNLEVLFPSNKMMLFAMGSEGYVKFTIASQPEVSYCSNCNCGKKEQADMEKKND